MNRNIYCLTVFLVYCTSTHGGQGFTCAEFDILSGAEKKQYIRGYTLGAAMEMQYFRGNIFSLRNKNTVKSASILSSTEDIEKSLEVIQRAIEYVDKKYDIVSIAVAHPEIFYQRVVARCSLESYGDLGMFQVLPGVLISMQKTGKYKVGGM